MRHEPRRADRDLCRDSRRLEQRAHLVAVVCRAQGLAAARASIRSRPIRPRAGAREPRRPQSQGGVQLDDVARMLAGAADDVTVLSPTENGATVDWFPIVVGGSIGLFGPIFGWHQHGSCGHFAHERIHHLRR